MMWWTGNEVRWRDVAFVILLALTVLAAVATASRNREQAASTKEIRSQTQVHRFWRLTGYPAGRAGYVVDHIIPLACGGPDHPLNMMWMSVEEAKAKDRWELQCARYCPPFNQRVKE